MKHVLRCLVIVPLLTVFIAMPAFAWDSGMRPSPMTPMSQSRMSTQPCEQLGEDESCPPGELMIVDALILRPLGLVSMAIGLAGSFAAMPWAATSCTGDCAGKELIEKPFNYTFCRPLGEVDH